MSIFTKLYLELSSLIPVFYIDLSEVFTSDTSVITGFITSSEEIDTDDFVLLADISSTPNLNVLANISYVSLSDDYSGIVYQYSFRISDVTVPSSDLLDFTTKELSHDRPHPNALRRRNSLLV